MASKFERCVKMVRDHDKNANAFSVCMASVGKDGGKLADFVDDRKRFNRTLGQILRKGKAVTVFIAERMALASDHGRLGKAPTKILLFKSGNTDIGDFQFDQKDAASVIAAFQRQGNEIPIDYHHASEEALSDKSVQAPAAGWVRGLEWIDGKGLFGTDIEWTEKAAAEILDLQFKYYSPAFLFRKDDGRVDQLTSVALTNMPRTRHQEELLRQAAERKAGRMSKHKKSRKGAAQRLLVTGKWRDEARDALKKYVAEELLPDVDVSVEALPDEEVEALDAVGALIAELAPMVDMAPEDGAEAILTAAMEMLSASKDAPPDGETAEITAELSKALGVNVKALRAEVKSMKIKAERSDALAKQVEKLESSVTQMVDERETAKVDKMLAEVFESGKLNPNDTKAVAAARAMASDNPDGFSALFASIESALPPGQTVSDSKVGGRRDGKIKSFCAEYNDNQEHLRCKKADFVNVSLKQAGMSPLNEDETKRMTA